MKRQCFERRAKTEGKLQEWFQKFHFRDRKKYKNLKKGEYTSSTIPEKKCEEKKKNRKETKRKSI